MGTLSLVLKIYLEVTRRKKTLTKNRNRIGATLPPHPGQPQSAQGPCCCSWCEKSDLFCSGFARTLKLPPQGLFMGQAGCFIVYAHIPPIRKEEEKKKEYIPPSKTLSISVPLARIVSCAWKWCSLAWGSVRTRGA